MEGGADVESQQAALLDGNEEEGDADEADVPAPTWFEHWVFRLLSEDARLYVPLYVLLTLAPFLTSAGSFLELFYGCPTVNATVEAFFAAGMFFFASVWGGLFHGLRRVVRGAHRNEQTLYEHRTGEGDDDELDGEGVEKLQRALEGAAITIQAVFRRHRLRQEYKERVGEALPDPVTSPKAFKEAARQAFDSADADGSGAIDADELRVQMERLGESPSQRKLTGLIDRHDQDHDGSLEFGEFHELMRETVMIAPDRRDIRQAFSVFDKNDDGFISALELRYAMTKLGDELNETELETFMEMIRGADTNDDGQVEYAEFLRMMEKMMDVPRPKLLGTTSQEGAESDLEMQTQRYHILTPGTRLRALQAFPQLRKAFDKFDADGSGSIDKAELGDVLEQLGERPSDEQLARTITGVDGDHSGTLDFDEFLELIKEGRVLPPELTRVRRRAKIAGLVVLGVQELQQRALKQEIERLQHETIVHEADEAFFRSYAERSSDMTVKSDGQKGPFETLAFDLEPGRLVRVEITSANYRKLIIGCVLCICYGAVFLLVPVAATFGIVELMRVGFDVEDDQASKAALRADELFFPVSAGSS